MMGSPRNTALFCSKENIVIFTIAILFQLCLCDGSSERPIVKTRKSEGEAGKPWKCNNQFLNEIRGFKSNFDIENGKASLDSRHRSVDELSVKVDHHLPHFDSNNLQETNHMTAERNYDKNDDKHIDDLAEDVDFSTDFLKLSEQTYEVSGDKDARDVTESLDFASDSTDNSSVSGKDNIFSLFDHSARNIRKLARTLDESNNKIRASKTDFVIQDLYSDETTNLERSQKSGEEKHFGLGVYMGLFRRKRSRRPQAVTSNSTNKVSGQTKIINNSKYQDFIFPSWLKGNPDSCENNCGFYVGYPFCSCRFMCAVFENCCDDFNDMCPEEAQKSVDRFGENPKERFQPECDSDSGMPVINTCPEGEAPIPASVFSKPSDEVRARVYVTDTQTSLTFRNESVFNCYREKIKGNVSKTYWGAAVRIPKEINVDSTHQLLDLIRDQVWYPTPPNEVYSGDECELIDPIPDKEDLVFVSLATVGQIFLTRANFELGWSRMICFDVPEGQCEASSCSNGEMLNVIAEMVGKRCLLRYIFTQYVTLPESGDLPEFLPDPRCRIGKFDGLDQSTNTLCPDGDDTLYTQRTAVKIIADLLTCVVTKELEALNVQFLTTFLDTDIMKRSNKNQAMPREATPKYLAFVYYVATIDWADYGAIFNDAMLFSIQDLRLTTDSQTLKYRNLSNFGRDGYENETGMDLDLADKCEFSTFKSDLSPSDCIRTCFHETAGSPDNVDVSSLNVPCTNGWSSLKNRNFFNRSVQKCSFRAMLEREESARNCCQPKPWTNQEISMVSLFLILALSVFYNG